MENKTKKWYQKLPDFLKAITAIIVAVSGLILAVNQFYTPEQDSNHPFDGTYQSIRGYTDLNRKSPSVHCKERYTFDSTITNSKITFKSDAHTFKGSVDKKGNITIDETGIWPQTKTTFSIQGWMKDANMTSGYCGKGYFSLHEK